MDNKCASPTATVLSILLPVYNEEDSLPLLFTALQAFIGKLSDVRTEVIFVDDHSSDASPKLLRAFCEDNHGFHHLRLARNSGSHIAIIAGLSRCSGDCAVFMAADLQDPPELINKMLAEWRSGAQTVWAVREKIEGVSFTTALFSRFFYQAMNTFGQVTFPPSGADFALLDRKVVDAVLESSGSTPSLGGIISSLGFRVREIVYVKRERKYGRSKWTFGKKFKSTIDAFVQFSFAPMRFMIYTGFILAMLGFLYACVVILIAIFGGRTIQGWSSLMVVVLVLGGLQMLMLGVLGEYLWRNLEEARKKPLFFIEEASSGLNLPNTVAVRKKVLQG